MEGNLINTLEIFADFSNEKCYSGLNEIEKLKTETDITIKWRAYLQNENVQKSSTKHAHILAKWADENNIGHDYRKIVFYNCLMLKKDISKNEVLEEIIDKLGFDEMKIEEVLEDTKYNEQVGEDLKRAEELGILEVPVILCNGEMLKSFVKYEELKDLVTKKVRYPVVTGIN